MLPKSMPAKCHFHLWITKAHVLDIFRLDMINFNLLKKTFVASQHGVVSTSIAFYDSFARVSSEMEILFLDKKVTCVLTSSTKRHRDGHFLTQIGQVY